MSYPNLQIPRPYCYYDSSLSFLLQTESASTAVDIAVYADDDTDFSDPVYTGSGTTDANGDLSGAIPITQAAFPVDGYILRCTVSGTDYDKTFYVERTWVYLQLLDSLLGGLKHLPRNKEPGELSLDLATLRFGYSNWQMDPAPAIVQNDTEALDASAVKMDYTNGKAYLLAPTTNGHDFRADYKFAYFGDTDLYNYLRMGLHTVNNKQPFTQYSLSSAPPNWEAPVTMAAYRMALRKLITDLGTFQFRRLFEDPASLIAQANSLYASTQTELDSMLSQVKRRGLLIPGAVRGWDTGRMPSIVDGGNFQQYTILA